MDGMSKGNRSGGEKSVSVPVKTFPNNFSAEQSVLCCVLIDGDAARNIVPTLDVQSFYSKKNKDVYGAVKDLYMQGNPVDLVTVYDYMSKSGTATDATLDYLTQLTELMPSAANYQSYVGIVKRDYLLRTIITKCNEIIERAYNSSDAVEVLKFAEQSIYGLSKDISGRGLVHISTSAMEVMEKIQSIQKDKNAFRGLPTGFKILDRVTSGLQDGDLIVLAARPGVGKTAFALNIVANVVKNIRKQKCIAIYSLEMPALHIVQRIVANMSDVPLADINSAELKGDDSMHLWTVVQTLSNSKIYINDSSLVTPADVISQCRRLAAEQQDGRVNLIIVDYLQLMDSETAEDNRQQEIAKMSRMMKVMARELNCPVLLISQMSRGIEIRKEKTPQLSDLRESGAIEQDADLVMFLYREESDDSERFPVMLDLQKHRNGELKTIRMDWRGEFMQFVESSDQRPFPKKNKIAAQNDLKE